MLVAVSPAGQGRLLSSDGLIAVDEAGIILGATKSAETLTGDGAPRGLKGLAFEAVFDMESRAVAKVPDRVLSLPMALGPAVNLSARLPRMARPADHPTAAPPGKAAAAAGIVRQLATGSKTMAAVCAQAETISHAGTPFLVEGETGAGKSTLIAALVGDAPLLKVDCASMADAAGDIENLRTVLGQARVLAMMPENRHRQATVVFDNLDELPPRARAELRRLMDELEADQQFAEAAGPGQPRIVALARQSLLLAVGERRFRDDLYYLVAATQVRLPALRDREQPEVLAQVLATRMAERPIDLSDEAASLIRSYPFLGKVRELLGALERALMTATSDRITPIDLGMMSILSAVPPAEVASTASAPRLVYGKRTLIHDALTSSGWNISEAAQRLGMGRATIKRKITRHGLVRPG